MTIRAVGGITLREAPNGRLQVLLIKKRGGMWTLPKGRVKRGEADEAAILRELAEETGLTGDVGEPVSMSSYKVIKAGKPRRKTVTYFLIWAHPGELRPGLQESIEMVRWMDVRRALKCIGRPRVRAVLRAALTLVG